MDSHAALRRWVFFMFPLVWASCVAVERSGDVWSSGGYIYAVGVGQAPRSTDNVTQAKALARESAVAQAQANLTAHIAREFASGPLAKERTARFTEIVTTSWQPDGAAKVTIRLARARLPDIAR